MPSFNDLSTDDHLEGEDNKLICRRRDWWNGQAISRIGTRQKQSKIHSQGTLL